MLVDVSIIALQLSRESYTLLFLSTVIDSREEQPLKQLDPKYVTEDGMVIDVREVQSQKQLNPKLVTEDGMTVVLHPRIILLVDVSIIALQLSRESYTLLFLSTVIDSREEQPLKQESPKLVTEDGMSMDVRDLQPLKHLSPKLVTEDGMVIDVREEQPLKQAFPKLVTLYVT